MTLFKPEKYTSTLHRFPYSCRRLHSFPSPIFLISLAVLPLRGDPLEKVLKFFLNGIIASAPLFANPSNILLN